MTCVPPTTHWWYRTGRNDWHAFSRIDSDAIEAAYTTLSCKTSIHSERNSNQQQQDDNVLAETTSNIVDGGVSDSVIVTVEGGRCDVDVKARIRQSVFWTSEANEVRRGTWLYADTDNRNRLVPFPEILADNLEMIYERHASVWGGVWLNGSSDGDASSEPQQYSLCNDNGYVVFHSPTVMLHYPEAKNTEAVQPRRMRRQFIKDVREGEQYNGGRNIKQLMLLVAGTSSKHDIVIEAADNMRELMHRLYSSHIAEESSSQPSFELLPILVDWPETSGSEDTSIQDITLKSVPILRGFVTSVLCETILCDGHMMNASRRAVVLAVNATFNLFRLRYPDFNGSVSLIGHSSASLVLWDVLNATGGSSDNVNESVSEAFTTAGINEDIAVLGVPSSPTKPLASPVLSETPIVASPSKKQLAATKNKFLKKKNVVSTSSSRKLLCDNVDPSPSLDFQPLALFSLGSPLGLFLSVRQASLGESFALSSCQHVFNIFHPHDPLAFRMESLFFSTEAMEGPCNEACQIEHWRGRKRMHLELKDRATEIGANLKNSLVSSVKAGWSLGWAALSGESKKPLASSILEQIGIEVDPDESTAPPQTTTEAFSTQPDAVIAPLNVSSECPLGSLNNGKRVDFELQSGPLEGFNQYLFSVQSHALQRYAGTSEDTALFVLLKVVEMSSR